MSAGGLTSTGGWKGGMGLIFKDLLKDSLCTKHQTKIIATKFFYFGGFFLLIGRSDWNIFDII